MNTIKYGICSASAVLKESVDIHNSRINKLLCYICCFGHWIFLPEAKPITHEIFKWENKSEKSSIKLIAEGIVTRWHWLSTCLLVCCASGNRDSTGWLFEDLRTLHGQILWEDLGCSRTGRRPESTFQDPVCAIFHQKRHRWWYPLCRREVLPHL